MISTHGVAQYSRINFKTDSTSVELVKNSEYKIWEETYNSKDSIFYSVRYIKDTTQINIEGWHRKNGQYIGKWSEYKIDGTWLYTIDYDTHTWTYNKSEFKYQSLKDKAKIKADSILMRIFGEEFFKANIVFNFDGHTYFGKMEMYDTDPSWSQEKYLGSWIEPAQQKPNSFVIAYDIKLSNKEFYNDILYVDIDSVGNLRDKSLILEKIQNAKKKKFTITKEKAIQICNQNTLKKSDNEYKTFFKFGYQENTPYSRMFYYEVVQQYDEIKDESCKNQCVMVKFFNIWRFNPYTSKLLFKKPMKKEFQLHNGCLSVSNFIEVQE